MKDICLGIILYNPTNEDLKNIQLFSSFEYPIYVYDNSPHDDICKPLYYEKLQKSITFLGDGKNNGLSIGCDELCSTAKNNGFKFILLLDQDSRIDKTSIEKLGCIAKKRSYAICTPQIVYQGENPRNDIDATELVSWCITSGSLINLYFYQKYWTFDKNYFIDRVDADCSRQIIKSGLQILRVNSSLLFQKLGEEKRIIGIHICQHSRVRHYYMFRNRLYFNAKYNIPLSITILQSFKHCISVLLFENAKKDKLKYMYKGFVDYKNKNFGKINQEKYGYSNNALL